MLEDVKRVDDVGEAVELLAGCGGCYFVGGELCDAVWTVRAVS